MQKLLITCLMLAPCWALAQGGSRAASVGVSVQRSSHFFTTFDGFPVNQTRYSSLVSGTPYLTDGFMPATIVLANGAAYEGVRMRMNLVENEWQYRDSKGAELVTKVPLKEVLVRDTILGKELKMVNSMTMPPSPPREGWYRVLAEGKASLYQLQERRLTVTKPFNSASEEQRVEGRDRLFVVINGQYTEVKKQKDLAPLFSDKKAAMDAWWRAQGSRSMEWAEVAGEAVQHYNSLHTEAARPAI